MGLHVAQVNAIEQPVELLTGQGSHLSAEKKSMGSVSLILNFSKKQWIQINIK